MRGRNWFWMNVSGKFWRYSVVWLVTSIIWLTLVGAVLGASGEFMGTSRALQGTVISTDVVTDTTWTVAGSPYTLTTGITVVSSATLEIEPGVEVRANSVGLDVQGTLLALGTSAAPITFTATSPVSGAWEGISIRGTTESPNVDSVLDYVVVEYGGWYGNLYLDRAQITLTHSVVRHSDEDGLYASTGAVAHISDTVFENNQRYAVYFEDGSVNPTLANLTARGNGYDGVAISSGTLTGDHTWENMGLPYVLVGGIYVDSKSALTVEPGVTVHSDRVGVTAYGTLSALGTVSRPITFTATSPVSGAWEGISIIGTADAPNIGSTFDHVLIEYGGWYGNLYLDRAQITLTHSVVRHSDEDGLYASTGAVAHISDTVFESNQRYAVYFEDGSVNPNLANLTARGNGYDGVAISGGTLTGDHTWENMGLPYILVGSIYVESGSALTVEPGVTVCGDGVGLTVYGALSALGTASHPITFTALTPTPGAWEGISIIGTDEAPNEGVMLEYVTLEYGGWYGNLYLDSAKASVLHCILRHSDADGIYAYDAEGTVIERSQIVDNADYGLRNDRGGLVLAANNWWGHASGPTHATCNTSGQGERVSDGVEFRPFLTSPDAEPGVFSPGDARILTLRPHRWFAPADGTMRVWVTLTLRDGLGRPLPGRTVRLDSTLGQTVDGGVTDIQGRTFAYLTSNAPGEAVLTAHLDYASACETATSAEARVTFTDPEAEGGLTGSSAPYMSDNIEISPLPLMRGVPATVRARLTNPNDFPILVDASFSLMQLGIGLTFGPIGEVRDFRIEANSDGVIEVPWTPAVSGHQCTQLQYSARSIDTPGQRRAAWGSSGSAQRNDDVMPGSLGSSTPGTAPDTPDSTSPDASGSEKGALETARSATGHIGNAQMVLDAVTAPANLAGMAIPNALFNKILDFNFNTWSEASKALGGDPPRQDYKTYAMTETLTFTPLEPSADLSAARAAAANDLMEAALDLTPNLRAATVSLDRYAGAAKARDQTWASQQAAALLHYKKASGQTMIRVADRVDVFLQVLRDEGIEDLVISPETVRAYQERLRTEGFNAEELQAANSIGLTDAEIAAILQERIAMDPEIMAGSVMTRMANMATALRELGALLLNPPNFPDTVVAAQGANSTITGNNLARIFDGQTTFQLGNPLSETATITLRVRRIDVPSSWMVSLAPPTVTLAPGAYTTITARVRPGTAAVQGTQPRLAVEGYISETLIGGVVLDVMVPRAAFFDGTLRLYLPLILKTWPTSAASSAPQIAGCSVLPADNIWNVPVDTLPVDANSAAYITTIGADTSMHPDFGSGTWEGAPIGIPYVMVDSAQPKIPVTFDYADESDPGPYPVPPDALIEGGAESDGDRHVLVLDRDTCVLYEMFYAFPQSEGSAWTAGSGAIFDLSSHALRPDTWTSADAAGLPILPGLVRYEEVAAGEIRHALRFTVPQTRDVYVWPARHEASSLTESHYPPMGQRFRLKADFNVIGFSPEARVILRALKTYGMMIADNGSAWYLSGVPDERWDNDVLRELRQVQGADFEAVDVSSLMVNPDSGQTQ